MSLVRATYLHCNDRAANMPAARPHRFWPTLLVVAALLSAADTARGDRLVAPLEAAIHVKALGYDRALKKRSGRAVSIVILYDADSSTSVSARNDMTAALRSLASKAKVQGLPIEVTSVAYVSGRIASAISGASAVYVAPNLDRHIADIVAASSTYKVPLLCGDRSLAVAGVTIAAYRKGAKGSLTINLRAARAAGMDLDSRLLGIAEVLR
jgi:ABC-type uncharacterized transport system substrate-binding protein